MPSQPARGISNKFRAEPFVNYSLPTLEEPRGFEPPGYGREPNGLVARVARDELESHRDEYDEQMHGGTGEESTFVAMHSSSVVGTRVPFRRNSLSARRNSSFSQAGPPPISSSISDIQRTSIASTSSSSSSAARRSSYDPNEPGVLEKIHTGQGKSKRKPIAVQQWTMMNTFKIRPASASEVISSLPPIPLSVAPDRPVPSSTTESSLDEEGNLVFVTEGGSANSIPQAHSIPRAVPLVVPPTTLKPPPPPAILPKSPRKRPRREEPNDPNIQVFYHEDIKPSTMDSTPSQPVDKTTTPPSVTPPESVIPMADKPTAGITPPITVTAPPLSTTPAAALNEGTIHPSLMPTKYDPVEHIFTLPETEPIERGGPPVKKWSPVYRQIRTIGGGTCSSATWISTGDAATPLKPPPGFTPGVPASGGISNLGMGSGFGGLMGLTQTTLSFAGSTGGGLAPAAAAGPKRVKKVKSDVSLGSGVATPLTGGTVPITKKRKGPEPGTKKGKKGAAGIATPSLMEPPLVSVSQALSDVDTEMHEA